MHACILYVYCMYIVCMLKLVIHMLYSVSLIKGGIPFHCTDLHMGSISVIDGEVYLPCGRLP